MELHFKKRFKKRITKLSKNLKLKTKEILILFIKNPLDSSLRRHKLKGKLKDYETIDVTGNFRILICEREKNLVEIVDIGNHEYFYD